MLTIEDMHETAAKRGGEFLSPTYEGVKEKHWWGCEHGHQWKATPNNIRRGKWCPYCYGRKKRP